MKQNFLKEAIDRKKQKVAELKQSFPEEQLKEKIASMGGTLGFREAVSKPKKINLIAEIKKASPSCGAIRPDISVAEVAGIYKDAGAAAISVLTEESFFAGSIEDLRTVREAVDIPILRKDFIIDPYQIFESRAFGADAVLLIADALTNEAIKSMTSLAGTLGLDCLVEVHNEKELKRVLNLKAPLIGVNNRDLNTLEVDFKTTEKLIYLIPRDKTIVVESGIKTHQDVLFLKILGINAVLIGEALMRAEDISAGVKDIMGW